MENEGDAGKEIFDPYPETGTACDVIARYTRPEMESIWTEENKFRTFLEIELLACEAQAKLGVIPKDAARRIRARAAFDVDRIREIERKVNHDVIAFLTNISEHVGAASRFVHYGLTSSDVLDTGLAVQMKRSAEVLLKDLRTLEKVLARRAREFKNTIMVGRTHGIHAEPTTFGLKLALWYDETRRNIERLDQARKRISVGKISGAVGTYEHLDPFVEEYVCGKLGLEPSPVSNQILQRDLHAEFLTTLAVIGGSLEKFAAEIRHLQKTEVQEVEEYFSKRQKGSSAMPHKRNPITCERIAGLARVLRGNAQVAMENISLWHERDISHSSAERIIIPDSCILLDYMITTFAGIIDDLVVYPENMKKNLGLTNGLVFSQSVLLALTHRGMKREDAYTVVQHHAMKVWRSKKNFRQELASDKRILKYLNADALEKLFDVRKSIKHVNHIFNRVGLK